MSLETLSSRYGLRSRSYSLEFERGSYVFPESLDESLDPRKESLLKSRAGRSERNPRSLRAGRSEESERYPEPDFAP